jgi:hypothetical protein
MHFAEFGYFADAPCRTAACARAHPGWFKHTSPERQFFAVIPKLAVPDGALQQSIEKAAKIAIGIVPFCKPSVRFGKFSFNGGERFILHTASARKWAALGTPLM